MERPPPTNSFVVEQGNKTGGVAGAVGAAVGAAAADAVAMPERKETHAVHLEAETPQEGSPWPAGLPAAAGRTPAHAALLPAVQQQQRQSWHQQWRQQLQLGDSKQTMRMP